MDERGAPADAMYAGKETMDASVYVGWPLETKMSGGLARPDY
jgi:hypothetical protein